MPPKTERSVDTSPFQVSDVLRHAIEQGIDEYSAQGAVEALGDIKDGPTLALLYPEITRVAKAGILHFPEAYSFCRTKLEQFLAQPEPDEALRIARQARVIACLLEITEGNFLGSGLPRDDPRHRALLSNLRSTLPSGAWTESAVSYEKKRHQRVNYVRLFLAGSLLKYTVTDPSYLREGWGSGFVYNRLLLDLAQSASGVYEKWTGEWAPHQAFDQALLWFLRSQGGSSGFRNLLIEQVRRNFANGIITPPPVSVALRQLMGEVMDGDLTDHDPKHHVDNIRRLWKEHNLAVRAMVAANAVWKKTYHPDEKIRYKELFESLQKDYGAVSIERILEMGCSRFGAAVALTRYFPQAEVVGCDLMGREAIYQRCRPDVQKMLDDERLKYVRWDITRGIPPLQEMGRFDLVFLLNSAVPHLADVVRLSNGSYDPLRGRVAAFESALRLASRAVIVAGGFGMNSAFSAENPHYPKPSMYGNSWIFDKYPDGSLSCTGCLFT